MVALPVVLMFVINVWMYHSFSMSIWVGLEVLAWVMFMHGVAALLMLHGAGMLGFLRPLSWLAIISGISVIGIIGALAWCYSIQNGVFLAGAVSNIYVTLVVLLVLGIVLNVMVVLQFRSSWFKLGFKHYLCIPLVVVGVYCNKVLIMDCVSEDASEELTFVSESDEVTITGDTGYRRGEVSFDLRVGQDSEEFLNRLVHQDLEYEGDVVSINVDRMHVSNNMCVVPRSITRGYNNLRPNSNEAHYNQLELSIKLEKGKSMPPEVRVKGYVYAELARPGLMLQRPYNSYGSTKSEGVESFASS